MRRRGADASAVADVVAKTHIKKKRSRNRENVATSDSGSKSPKSGANWNAARCSTHGLGSVWSRTAMCESGAHAAGPPGFWEKRGMSGVRCHHILASAAVALLLAAPLCALAQETGLSAPASVADETPAPDTLASLDPADRVIAERIRDLLAAKPDRIFASKNEHAAVEAFYQKRNLAPLWLDKGVENARAQGGDCPPQERRCRRPRSGDYKTPNFAGLASGCARRGRSQAHADRAHLCPACAGRAFSLSLVREDNIGLPQAPPDPAAGARPESSEAADAGKALDEFSPQNEPYQKLKMALAEMRGRTAGGGTRSRTGPVLSYNRKHPMEDARVPSLRERLKLSGEASDLAIRRQARRRREAIPARKRAAGDRQSRCEDGQGAQPSHAGPAIDTVIANMERWRWYPRDLGNAHVMVNQPDFTLKVMHEGGRCGPRASSSASRACRPRSFSEKMKSVTINPTWNVPPSIVHNEYLPALAKDPAVLSRMGLRVNYSGRRGADHACRPAAKTRSGASASTSPTDSWSISTTPRTNIMFAHDVRAESHGCMRVQDPAKYAEVLFHIARPDEQWTAEKVKSMFGSTEQDIQLQSVPIWIHLTYQTAFVDDAGKLQMRRDLYNLDSRTLAAIKGSRAILDPAPEQKHEPEIAAPARSAPAHHRRLAHRARQVATYQPIFSNSGMRYARPRPPRGAFYR